MSQLSNAVNEAQNNGGAIFRLLRPSRLAQYNVGAGVPLVGYRLSALRLTSLLYQSNLGKLLKACG